MKVLTPFGNIGAHFTSCNNHDSLIIVIIIIKCNAINAYCKLQKMMIAPMITLDKLYT